MSTLFQHAYPATNEGIDAVSEEVAGYLEQE